MERKYGHATLPCGEMTTNNSQRLVQFIVAPLSSIRLALLTNRVDQCRSAPPAAVAVLPLEIDR